MLKRFAVCTVAVSLVSLPGCGENYVVPVPAEAPEKADVKSDSSAAASQPTLKKPHAEPKDIVRLTRPAVDKLQELRKSSGARFLRVGVKGNDQMGYSYDLRFDDWADPENDYMGRSEGFRIVVSKRSAPLLEGTTIDWRETAEGEGFAFDNPNAKPVEQPK